MDHLIEVWGKILEIPYHVLYSLILLLCFIGSQIANNNPYDVTTILDRLILNTH